MGILCSEGGSFPDDPADIRPTIHSVLLPGPAPAGRLRRPWPSPVALCDLKGAFAGGAQIADARPPSAHTGRRTASRDLSWRESPRFAAAPNVASKPAAGAAGHPYCGTSDSVTARPSRIRCAGLRPSLTAADFVLESPAPVCAITMAPSTFGGGSSPGVDQVHRRRVGDGVPRRACHSFLDPSRCSVGPVHDALACQGEAAGLTRTRTGAVSRSVPTTSRGTTGDQDWGCWPARPTGSVDA